MQHTPRDIVHKIASYLNDGENLVLSTVTKQDWEIDREKYKKNIIYRWVIPICTVSDGNWFASDKTELQWIQHHTNHNPNYSFETKRKCVIMYMQDFANNLLSSNAWLPSSGRTNLRPSKYDYTIITNYYYKPPKLIKKYVVSSKSLEEQPQILTDQPYCIIYNCRFRGKIRRMIKKSPVLKALVG